MDGHGERTTDVPVDGQRRPPVAVPTGSVPGTGPSDVELLRAHVAGDRYAFTELFHRHRDRLWAVALRTVGDREEAADGLQDALLSAHRAAARFRGDSAVTTWLHRIVVNACLDRIRRRQAHPTVPLPDGTHGPDDGPSTGGVEPAAPVQDHDTALVVRQALAELPVEQRSALVLVDVQGYPVAEVARILGVAEGTVKSRCARGRARLAVALGHLRTGVVPEGTTGADADEGPNLRSGRPGRVAPPQDGRSGARVQNAAPPDAGAGPDVPVVTRGNPGPAGGVRSGSGRSRRDANQEES
ncbi:RNA polymerase sigma factor SigM [Micromonospora sp. NBC_01655]|uniref:RNA polymerase sigma factor SigM n=1 Tax=Micromonospora sp. NBC_01655 TaxID=2975983 RepID=UPI00225C01B7|nr:RNA polymerase sigma factor SigM [Micromonospora sp. NBC_01655]MCX4469212.1 RNA polymerase sigma factor SigM [Micromonospora sp. NBC_01655]